MPRKHHPSITDLSVEDLRRLVCNEVESTIKDELIDLTNRLEKTNWTWNLLRDFKVKID